MAKNKNTLKAEENAQKRADILAWEGDPCEKPPRRRAVSLQMIERIRTVGRMDGHLLEITVYFFDKCQNFVLQMIDGG